MKAGLCGIGRETSIASTFSAPRLTPLALPPFGLAWRKCIFNLPIGIAAAAVKLLVHTPARDHLFDAHERIVLAARTRRLTCWHSSESPALDYRVSEAKKLSACLYLVCLGVRLSGFDNFRPTLEHEHPGGTVRKINNSAEMDV